MARSGSHAAGHPDRECWVWTELGFGDSCAETITADLFASGVTAIREYAELAAVGALPGWRFDPAVQQSHRSALLRKDPKHYGPLFPGTPVDLGYVWPVRSPAVVERELRKEENAAPSATHGRTAGPRAGPRPETA